MFKTKFNNSDSSFNSNFKQDQTSMDTNFDGYEVLKGEDGFSPIVSVTSIEGGHSVTITDKNGDQTFNVMDGQGADDDVLALAKEYVDAELLVAVEASKADASNKAIAVLAEAQKYTDESIANIGDIPSIEGLATEEFVLDEISKAFSGGNLDDYETKEDASAKLAEAKSYTDEAVATVIETTKADALNIGIAVLAEAQKYTDEAIGNIEIPEGSDDTYTRAEVDALIEQALTWGEF